ncbi:MAG: hypothetical protein QM784_27365 [Polyangiaceae bacterium]
MRVRIRTVIAAVGSALTIMVACCFLLYPGFATIRMLRDPGVRATGQPSDLPEQFRALSRRYLEWANGALASRRLETVAQGDVAATEWPLFGTIFFLTTAEQLVREGKLTVDDEMRASLSRAAEVVVHPATATWVRKRWGATYLERENVFYRMLVVMGLSSFERATGDRRHHAWQEAQAQSLSRELLAAPYHLADDYPDECYPTDVLWAVVAARRALGDTCCNELTAGLMTVLDGRLRDGNGLPAFSVDSRTAQIRQGPRGSGNSGILSFAGELNPKVAAHWYKSYVDDYWVDGFIKGFREVPKGAQAVADVDSGLVLFDIGSVASVFGIGAARANGRYDHASALSQEVFAASWPTPFGLLIPGLLGYFASEGWCFGELALSFALTRPNYVAATTPSDGSVPRVVWLFLCFYLGTGFLLIIREYVYWRKRLVVRVKGAHR